MSQPILAIPQLETPPSMLVGGVTSNDHYHLHHRPTPTTTSIIDPATDNVSMMMFRTTNNQGCDGNNGTNNHNKHNNKSTTEPHHNLVVDSNDDEDGDDGDDDLEPLPWEQDEQHTMGGPAIITTPTTSPTSPTPPTPPTTTSPTATATQQQQHRPPSFSSLCPSTATPSLKRKRSTESHHYHCHNHNNSAFGQPPRRRRVHFAMDDDSRNNLNCFGIAPSMSSLGPFVGTSPSSTTTTTTPSTTRPESPVNCVGNHHNHDSSLGGNATLSSVSSPIVTPPASPLAKPSSMDIMSLLSSPLMEDDEGDDNGNGNDDDDNDNDNERVVPQLPRPMENDRETEQRKCFFYEDEKPRVWWSRTELEEFKERGRFLASEIAASASANDRHQKKHPDFMPYHRVMEQIYRTCLDKTTPTTATTSNASRNGKSSSSSHHQSTANSKATRLMIDSPQTFLSPRDLRALKVWTSLGHSRRGLERWSVPKIGSHVQWRRQMMMHQLLKIQYELDPARVSPERREHILAHISEFYSAPARAFARTMGQADFEAAHAEEDQQEYDDDDEGKKRKHFGAVPPMKKTSTTPGYTSFAFSSSSSS